MHGPYFSSDYGCYLNICKIYVFFQVCPNDHVGWRWCSQPRLRARGVPAGDFMMATNILLSGNNFAKVSLLLNFTNLGCPQSALFDAVQALHCVPEIEAYWDSLQASVHDQLKDKSLVLAGMLNILKLEGV